MLLIDQSIKIVALVSMVRLALTPNPLSLSGRGGFSRRQLRTPRSP